MRYKWCPVASVYTFMAEFLASHSYPWGGAGRGGAARLLGEIYSPPLFGAFVEWKRTDSFACRRAFCLSDFVSLLIACHGPHRNNVACDCTSLYKLPFP